MSHMETVSVTVITLTIWNESLLTVPRFEANQKAAMIMAPIVAKMNVPRVTGAGMITRTALSNLEQKKY